jgi:hypothetical protein
MPVFENSCHIIGQTMTDDQECDIYLVKGRVSNDSPFSALYQMQTSVANLDEAWVLELKKNEVTLCTVLMRYWHNSLGFHIVDPIFSECDQFPPYEASSVLTRRQFLATDFSNVTFALIDEICLQDEEIRSHHDEWRHMLYCEDLGAFYVSDALQIYPVLLADDVACEFFLMFDEKWKPVNIDALQAADKKQLARIVIPKQHKEIAYYHWKKIFPKGSSYFLEIDSLGDGDWLDNETACDAEKIEEHRNLTSDLNDLQRQLTSIESEIAEVAEEMRRESYGQRFEALQRAQKTNYANQSTLKAAIELIAGKIDDVENSEGE